MEWERLQHTNDSFLFSFADRNNLQSTKVGYCNQNQYAIYCHSTYGPTFGGGYDLYCRNDDRSTCSSGSSSYPNVGIPSGVSIMSDYEVFQVIKE